MSEFEIVDVFTEGPRRGNQLAVVFPSRALDDAEMQSIASEFDFSETTFVTGERDGGFAVRIFTPVHELPFAGHPTLGTASVLRARHGGPESVLLHLGVGPVRVDFQKPSDGGLEVGWIAAPTPELLDAVPAETAAALYRLDHDDLDPDLPAQVVKGGIPFVLVGLRSLDALRRVRLDADVYRTLPTTGSFCFTREAYTPSRQIAARMLWETNGNQREDPATGSANTALAGYLLHHRVYGDGPLDIQVEQGVECNRPSLLRLRGRLEDGRARVQVGGSVLPFARGTLA